MQRCEWCHGDPLYQAYHDQEWGVPCFDSQVLFEFLILEGMQAGLSWITVLKKRAAIKATLHNFEVQKLALLSEEELYQALQNPNIIRSQMKLRSAVHNAKCVLSLNEQGVTLTSLLWNFVEGEPLQNKWQTQSEIPAKTAISIQMAKELKRLGFQFIGPTICYALMQAVGMVNDHVRDCFRYHECKMLASEKPSK